MNTTKTAFIFCICILLGSFPLLCQEVNYDALKGLGDTHYHQIDYQPLEQTYHIFVRLPDNYEPTESYPTIYLLDGGITYPMLTSYYQTMVWSEVAPEVILVGISYGSFDWKGGNNRSRDYTAPCTEREYWGGAEVFTQFFKDELFQLIESTYSSNASRRIVFGNSLGGQFVLFAAQYHPGLFWGHIASNPALHRNLDYFIEASPLLFEQHNDIKLFVGSGTKDDERFRKPAKSWMTHWTQKKDVNWTLKASDIQDKDHFTALPDIFYQGLLWLFEG